MISRMSSRTGFEPHRQHFALIRDEKGSIVDHTMIVYHPGPDSYTGEDLAEISCHGNPLIVARILDILSASGLGRPAHKGEFTRRAFLNGKIDLVQAEAVAALIDSRSTTGCEMAGSLLRGGLSDRVVRIREDLIGILADIEASFVTGEKEPEDLGVMERLLSLSTVTEGLLRNAHQSARLYEGVVTTIAGLPNAGKSSLFNAVIGYDRAIVHHEEGTTRDVLREHLLIDGVDFVFHDTAGIRDTASGPEQLGVERTLDALRSSDLLLYVVDTRQGMQPHERQWLNIAGKTIVVMNKIDLAPGTCRTDSEYPTVHVSAKYGTGIPDLKSAMSSAFPHDQTPVFLDRHAHLLRKVHESLESSRDALEQGLTLDAVSIDLRQAAGYLSQMTGASVDEDILENIFSRFCIGK